LNAISSLFTRPHSSLLFRLRLALAALGQCRQLRLRDSVRLTKGKVRVPFEGFPIQILLGQGGKRLHLYPEELLGTGGRGDQEQRFLIVDPAAYFHGIGGFLRLQSGDQLILGRNDPHQQAMFGYPETVEDYHLLIIHDGDGVVFHNLAGSGSCIAPALNEARLSRLDKLRRLREIFGGPIGLLPKKEALDLLQRVNALMEKEKYRKLDHRGLSGGLIELPDSLTPILISDLHAQVDNLLTVLTQNGFLDALEDGTAYLVILGDAVHSEIDGQMEEMETSMLLMDLIFSLKLQFPEQVFYIRGNHDAFYEEIAKDGIPQGLLWAKALRQSRGKAYFKAMERFYELVPYVAVSRDFLACHAGAPKSKISPDMLVEIHRYPGLILELINNRMQRPNRPQGYTKGDIKRFRKALGLAPDTPFIVGHTPIDRSETLWLDVAGIPNHHILFSANTDQVGIFTRIDGVMVPLRYRAEPLTEIINALSDLPQQAQPPASTTSEPELSEAFLQLAAR